MSTLHSLHAVIWDCLCLFNPSLPPFYSHSDSASAHETVSQSRSQQHLYASTCETAHTVLKKRFFSHWCAERSSTAKPHIWEVDRRTDEETPGGSECTLSGCREKLFFQPFSSWHTGKVCEILFEVHRCAHFKVHLTLPACILPETGRGDTGFLSGGTMEYQPGKNTHTLRNSSICSRTYSMWTLFSLSVLF